MLEVKPVREITQDNGRTRYLCPFCSVRMFLDNPNHPGLAWQHNCPARATRRVWFVNEHAIAGIGDYVAAQVKAGAE